MNALVNWVIAGVSMAVFHVYERWGFRKKEQRYYLISHSRWGVEREVCCTRGKVRFRQSKSSRLEMFS